MNGLLTSVFVLFFSSPDIHTTIAAYDTEAECEEVAWVMQRWLTGDAVLYCVKESEA
jgi:hypothetical protein